ncbi:TetR/AcrR family transcriptional regulator [Sphingobium sp. CCH11-B1]|jgi:TetR/AcrR family transcriptional repressor of uid operon|uniref:TetR/AcrR family transcriptional regulator n=1 Tax=Sphingobium sp. CCH11-B1 TaxID=1768781 RepID=UPI0008340680|nr:TetR/AcrR family transcriptional regulator [Sphingobium sp. CCH11-B1]
MVAVQHEKNGRTAVLAAARDLFDSHGFHQTSMAELAASAHVSVGQIYRLFKGKEDIIEALIIDNVDQSCAEMTALCRQLDSGELSVDQAFEALLRYTVDSEDEALSFDIFAESFRNEAVSKTIGDMCARFRNIIRYFAYAANPRLAGQDLDAAEEVVLACMFGLGHRSLSRPKLDAACTAALSAKMILAALRSLAPAPAPASR